MGSSGSGSFTDYSGSAPRSTGTGGSSGGGSGTDKCREAFSTGLEDVANYDYFIQHDDVPAQGTALTLAFENRIVALDEMGVAVGALPTRFNYIAACLNEGIQYTGIVRAASNGAEPRVDADFVAT